MLKDKITNLLVAVLCITPLLIVPLGIDYFYYPKILVVYILLALIILQIVKNAGNYNIKKSLYFDLNERIILYYLATITISTYFSMNIKASLWGRPMREEGLFAVISYVLLYLFSKRSFNYKESYLFYYMLTVSIVSLYGILQYQGIDPVPRDIFRSNWKNAFSTLGNPNFLGTYLVLSFPIAIFAYVNSKKNIYLLILSLIYICLLNTNTRGAWVGAIFSVTILIYYMIILKNNKKRILYTLLCITTITVIYNLSNNNIFLQRFLTIYNDATKLVVKPFDYEKAGSNRIFIWTRVIKLIKENSVLGVGLDSLDVAFTEKFGSDMVHYFGRKLPIDKAHNEYLNIAVSTGIPSLILYLTFIVNITIKGFMQIKNNYLILPLLCSVIGYLVQAFFNISVVSVAPIFWIFLGLLYKISDETENIKEST